MRTLIAVISFLTLTACTGGLKTQRLQVQNFDKQGHRGCRGLMPENTIPAMLHAIDLGVTTLETDAVITQDKQVLLSHEPFFNHEITTKPDGSPVTEAEEKKLNLYRMNYADIKTYDVGQRPHPRFPQQQKMAVSKPLLADMIDAVEMYCRNNQKPLPQYNIETKSQPATDNQYHPQPAEFVELLVGVIKAKNIAERVIIQSFDPRTLQYLHAKCPSIKTALLVEGNDSKPFALQLRDLGFIPAIYSPAHTLVTPLLVKQCRDAAVGLVPWTVNDAVRIKELKKMGVTGVISDYPDLFKGL
jgi:glycerophosphoryl diester phosphodiesterase